jgi:hypothetical protein
VHDEDAWRDADLRDRRNVTTRVIRQILVERRPGRDGDVIDEERVAVARRFRNDVGAQCAARARAVVDDERLPELFAELLSEITRNEIARAAGRKRHDQPHGLARVDLCMGGTRQCGADHARSQPPQCLFFHVISSRRPLDGSSGRIVM